jgi:hypothetical protein
MRQAVLDTAPTPAVVVESIIPVMVVVVAVVVVAY